MATPSEIMRQAKVSNEASAAQSGLSGQLSRLLRKPVAGGGLAIDLL
ncbi:MAG: hypothetical protein V9G13_05545 [Marmoricola sp.]